MTAQRNLQLEGAAMRGAALALDCLTTALRLVPTHAPRAKFEAAVWRCVFRITQASSPPPELVREALESEVRKLLNELRAA